MVFTVKRSNPQTFGAAVHKYGLIRLVDLALDSFSSRLREKFYTKAIGDYGLFEAVMFPRAIDYYTRYRDVVDLVQEHIAKGSLILDVGAGMRGGLSFFLQSDGLIQLDRRSYPRKPWFGQIVIADGCRLPFKNGSIDLVVAVATLEHVPTSLRSSFLQETKRVGKSVILHFPCQDKDKRYFGRTSDILFQAANESILREKDERTAEHIASIHPSVKQITTELPGSKIVGRKNCSVWLTYMTFSRRPIIGFLAGLLYLTLWKPLDNKPPFYECLVEYSANGSGQDHPEK